MVAFERHVLDNGLTVLIHQDPDTPLATVNLLYKVGSRDESPDRTGFAHLFEHLMFGGSAHAPSFDDLTQLAGGDCNAYTNADITNFYVTLPAVNLDMALWLEADRMQHLTISQKTLSTQQQVVVEEFKETCINQPYGMVWHQLAGMCYTRHPYRWPTIGLEISHIAEAKLSDVKTFYTNFYGPNNAILAIAGPLEPAEVLEKVKTYFGPIAHRPVMRLPRLDEPVQTAPRLLEDKGAYPSSVLYLAWRMDSRNGPDYYAYDLLSDALSLGRSSILYQQLVKVRKICAHADAYITGSEDEGLFIIELRPSAGYDLDAIEAALWEELKPLQDAPIGERTLDKLKNKNESTVAFANTSCAQKATNLAYYESLGDAGMMNTEADRINEVTADDIMRVARKLTPGNVNTLRLVSDASLAPVMADAEDDDEDDEAWD